MPRRAKTSNAGRKNLQKQLETMKSTCLKSSANKAQKVSMDSSLPDLRKILMENGMYDQYVAWQKNYLSWRKGGVKGAQGEAASSSLDQSLAWRDGYHRWRQGAMKGAKGKVGEPLQQLTVKEASVFYDVVADENGQPMLVPIDGPEVKGLRIEEFPPKALVTVRAFRFFEDRSDENEVWEQKLRNLNSGSLLWLPVHLTPGMHSVSGAKYGRWFTIHYLQVKAKHFKSAYHMCNEGWSLANSFGAAVPAMNNLIKGEPLKEGYFWFVSPTESSPNTSQHAQLESKGWKHLAREGPFDGARFVEEWRQKDSPLATRDLQAVLDKLRGEQ